MTLLQSFLLRWPREAWSVVCCGFVLSLVTTLAGAEGVKKAFDIPAGAGDAALTLFSAQSGIEVVFGTATAAEVKTSALKGEYGPREAIARLLAGTGLVIVPNDKTGALTISRDPNGQRAAQDRTCDRPSLLQLPRLLNNFLTL